MAEDRERSAPAPVQDQEEAAAGEAAGRRAPDGDREGAWEKLEDGSKFLELSMGPQHPSTHGVLRLAVRLDGEEVVDCKVDIGYLHRSFEKFAETWQYPQLAPFVDRNDYLAGTLNEHAYCLAVERLLGLEVPERAEYIRVIMAELNRIGSHLIWFGAFAMRRRRRSLSLQPADLVGDLHHPPFGQPHAPAVVGPAQVDPGLGAEPVEGEFESLGFEELHGLPKNRGGRVAAQSAHS